MGVGPYSMIYSSVTVHLCTQVVHPASLCCLHLKQVEAEALSTELSTTFMENGWGSFTKLQYQAELKNLSVSFHLFLQNVGTTVTRLGVIVEMCVICLQIDFDISAQTAACVLSLIGGNRLRPMGHSCEMCRQ